MKRPLPASRAHPGDDHADLPHGAYNRDRALAVQWAALLLAPATFLVHLQVAYVMVPWACAHDGELWIHVAGALSVLLGAVGMLIAWRLWSRARRTAPGEAPDLESRARFVGVSGFAMSAVITLVLLAQWVAAFVIDPCQ